MIGNSLHRTLTRFEVEVGGSGRNVPAYQRYFLFVCLYVCMCQAFALGRRAYFYTKIFGKKSLMGVGVGIKTTTKDYQFQFENF